MVTKENKDVVSLTAHDMMSLLTTGSVNGRGIKIEFSEEERMRFASMENEFEE